MFYSTAELFYANKIFCRNLTCRSLCPCRSNNGTQIDPPTLRSVGALRRPRPACPLRRENFVNAGRLKSQLSRKLGLNHEPR